MGISLRRYVLPRLEALRLGQEREGSQIVIVAHGVAIAELLRVLKNLHDTSSTSPWPDPRENYTRVRMENTGWTLVELAVPVEEADEEGFTGKRPTYFRIVQQNNTDHLRTATTSPKVGNDMKRGVTNGGRATPPILGPKAINAYDSKYMMRELERAGSSSTMLSGSALGNSNYTLAGSNLGIEGMLAPPLLPSTSTPTLLSSPAQSISTIQSPAVPSLSPNLSLANAPSAWSDLWHTICVRILPLFNDEGLRGHVEDINDSISNYIHKTLDRSPARAMDALSKDLYALCATGMYTLNARLNSHFQDDFRLLEALTEIWTSFFVKVLPWLEACFLPLQTDPTLATLTKGDDKPVSLLQMEAIDVRKVALSAFRDQILIPWFDRLQPLLSRVGEFDIDIVRQTRRLDVRNQATEDRVMYPRLMQMINIISSSIQESQEIQSYLDELIRSLRAGYEIYLAALNPQVQSGGGPGGHSRDEISSSATLTSMRDKRTNARHGWLPASAAKHGNKVAMDTGKENAYLSSLKSPTVEEPEATTSDSIKAVEVGNNNSRAHRASLDKTYQEYSDRNNEDTQVLPLSDKSTSIFAPFAEPAIGLGLPTLEQWDDGEN